MGGCRCSFQNCSNTSNNSPKCHFFHFPVKNKERCTEWIKSTNNSSLIDMPIMKLKNKVVCDKHFSINLFMNYKRDRLVKNAIPNANEETDNSDRIKDLKNLLKANEADKSNIDFAQSITKPDNTKLIVTDMGTSGLVFSDSILRITSDKTTIIESPKINKDYVNKAMNTFSNNRLSKIKSPSVTDFTDLNFVYSQDLNGSDSDFGRINTNNNKQEVLKKMSQNVCLNDNKPTILEVISLNNSKAIDNTEQIAVKKAVNYSSYYKHPLGMQVKSKPVHSLTKQQLFQGIKKYLSPSMEILLRMELFGSLDRIWKHDEKQLSIEFMNFGDEVYTYMTEELRWRLPSPTLVKQWKVQDYNDEEFDM